MKKTILLATALLSFNAYSQTEKKFIIEHCIDKMTDKEYFLSSKNFVCANNQKTEGFVITNAFKSVDGKLQQNGIILKNIGIGNCDEKDELIFLFEDDSKITITAWNKFNCESVAYFDLSESDLTLLKSKKINAIRFKNGYSFESLTYILKKEEQSFFINVYSNNIIKEINCDN
jgi:hypothetical protein